MGLPMDIFNFVDNIKKHTTEINKEDLAVIVEECKHGHFLHVLSKTKTFRENHTLNDELAKLLLLLDATCLSQVGEGKKAADIIERIYQDSNGKLVDDLILYGNLAFMCDYKLTRKIMSDAVKRINHDPIKAAHAYFILGEAEEHLGKFIRAIKYYKRGLGYLEKAEERDDATILYLHFKLGDLHSIIHETDQAIEFLQKAIELADDTNQEIKINSLVSIAKMYGSKRDYEKAFTYLKEAIPMLEGSTLENKLVHAEAYTEMAYNYFDQSKFDEAAPYYEKAITIQQNLPYRTASRELGMIYMQYAYSMEHREKPEKLLAGINYERAIEQLEKANDYELLTSALGDTIAFFKKIGNKKKVRFYENKFVKVTNEKKHSF